MKRWGPEGLFLRGSVFKIWANPAILWQFGLIGLCPFLLYSSLCSDFGGKVLVSLDVKANLKKSFLPFLSLDGATQLLHSSLTLCSSQEEGGPSLYSCQ